MGVPQKSNDAARSREMKKPGSPLRRARFSADGSNPDAQRQGLVGGNPSDVDGADVEVQALNAVRGVHVVLLGDRVKPDAPLLVLEEPARTDDVLALNFGNGTSVVVDVVAIHQK